MTRTGRPSAAVVLGVVLTLGPSLGQGEILHVPDQYPTINAAVIAAHNGDVVRVGPGTYIENVDFLGKAIVVTSHYVDGGDWSVVERTVIDGSDPVDPDAASTVVLCSGEGRESVLRGFTVTGGRGTVWVDPQFPSYTWRGGGGIFCSQSSPTIICNRITANTVDNPGDVDGAQAGGVLTYDGDPWIQSNLITGNQADYGGGLVVDYSGALVCNNVIAGNVGGDVYGGGGIWTIGSGAAPIVLENNTIADNTSLSRGGALYVWGSTVSVRGGIIWGNTQSLGGPIHTTGGGLVDMSYSDVELGYAGTGNVDLDPLFETSYVLHAASPCVDGGAPDPDLNDQEDPARPGMARWPSRGGLRNDMGAYGGPLGAMALLGVRPGQVFADGFEGGDHGRW
jgi:hypothetical protein